MAGYTRQSAADIVTGADILAAPLNNEFNQIQAAFNGTTGHTHDGSTGNSPKISLTTSVSGILPVANGGAGLISVDNTVPRYNGTTGILQASGVVINNSAELTAGTGTVITATSADQLVAINSTVTGLLIENTDTAGSGFITFGDGAIAGRISYNHSTNDMALLTNGTNALVLSSAGAGVFTAGVTATIGTFSDFINLTGGQITFPATQIKSANANTLDDYEEGTWTPTLTFDTPGNLSVTYGVRTGKYIKIGRVVTLNYFVTTTVFTHTTASGALKITGMPFSADSGGSGFTGSLLWQGITAADYTDVSSYTSSGSTDLLFVKCGSGQVAASVLASNMPTGGSVRLEGSITYINLDL